MLHSMSKRLRVMLRAVLDALKGNVFPGGAGQMGACPTSFDLLTDTMARRRCRQLEPEVFDGTRDSFIARGETDGLMKKTVVVEYELQRAELQRKIADFLGYVPSHASCDEPQPPVAFGGAFAPKSAAVTADMRNPGNGGTPAEMSNDPMKIGDVTVCEAP